MSETWQILLGSILGDGSLDWPYYPNGNVRYIEAHSMAQKDYLNWKAEKLAELDTRFAFHYFKGSVRPVLWTRHSYGLKCLHPLFYIRIDDGWRKQLPPMEILQELDQLGIAVWYCDDGGYDKAHSWSFIAPYPHSEALKLKRYFEEEWALSTRIYKDGTFKDGQAKYRLWFDVPNTHKFLLTVKEPILSMPKCVHYKLGHLLPENMPEIKEAKERQRKRARRNYWKDPERRRVYSRKYGKTHLEERRNYNREWRRRNPEKVKEYKKRDRQKHKARCLRYNKEYFLKHPEKKREYQARYYQRHKEQRRKYLQEWRRRRREMEAERK